MALSKEYLTGGTGDGTGIKIAATTLGGADTVHTVPASKQDTIRLLVTNNDTVQRTVTLLWGGATAVDDEITVPVGPKQGLYLVVPGLPLGAAKVVKAYAEVTNVIVVHGDVNRVDA